jgi:DNA-binding CsgD family transcriptional regulator/tetratricopeptide (TPR) repeat protein
MLRGDHPQAIAVANAAIVLARLAGAPTAEAHALNTLGTSTTLTGRSEEGLRILYEAFAKTKSITDAYDDLGRSYANLSSCLLIAGRAQESFDVAMEGTEWARSVGSTGGYGRFIGGNAADAAIELGRWDEAEAMLDEILASDAVGVNRLGTITIAGRFYVRRGRIEAAAAMLEEGRRLVEPLLEAQFTGPIYVGLVELAIVERDAESATARAAAGVRQLRRTEDVYYIGALLAIAARAEADLAELARDRHDTDRAERASMAAREYADQATALAHAAPNPKVHGGRLGAFAALAVAEAGRAAGSTDAAPWQAAERALKATSDTWHRAYVQFRMAEVLLGTPAGRRAAEPVLREAHAVVTGLGAEPLRGWIEALARRARITVDAPGAVADPAEGRGEPDDAGLTAREREVLALVADGFTNRRIAETLFISESTAGVHVSNILGKLGVATRTEAAAVATRLGLVG